MAGSGPVGSWVWVALREEGRKERGGREKREARKLSETARGDSLCKDAAFLLSSKERASEERRKEAGPRATPRRWKARLIICSTQDEFYACLSNRANSLVSSRTSQPFKVSKARAFSLLSPLPPRL